MEAHVCHIHATSKIRVDRAGWSRSIGGVAGSASIPAGVSPSYTPAASLCAGAGTIETGLQRRVCELLVPKRWSPNCRSALTRDRQCPRGPSRDLARQMADTRTMLTASWSLQRADHAEQRDACDPAQRLTAAPQQGYRFPLELIRKMTPSLAHSTPFRSRRSLAKVSTNSREPQLAITPKFWRKASAKLLMWYAAAQAASCRCKNPRTTAKSSQR